MDFVAGEIRAALDEEHEQLMAMVSEVNEELENEATFMSGVLKRENAVEPSTADIRAFITQAEKVCQNFAQSAALEELTLPDAPRPPAVGGAAGPPRRRVG